MKQLYLLVILFFIIFQSELDAQREENIFIVNAKSTLENFYSKLDNIHDLNHPLNDTNLYVAKRIIIEELLTKNNGRNLYDNISKASYSENFYSPEEYLDYYIAEYSGLFVQHDLEILNGHKELRTSTGNKVVVLNCIVRLIQLQGQQVSPLRIDTIFHYLIFNRSQGFDLPELPQIQSTEKYKHADESFQRIIKVDTPVIISSLDSLPKKLEIAQIDNKYSHPRHAITEFKLHLKKSTIIKLSDGYRQISISEESADQDSDKTNIIELLHVQISTMNNRWEKKSYITIQPKLLEFKSGKKIYLNYHNLVFSYNTGGNPNEDIILDLSNEKELLTYINENYSD